MNNFADVRASWIASGISGCSDAPQQDATLHTPQRSGKLLLTQLLPQLHRRYGNNLDANGDVLERP